MTGAGAGSIGAQVLQGLISGGAKVVVNYANSKDTAEKLPGAPVEKSYTSPAKDTTTSAAPAEKSIKETQDKSAPEAGAKVAAKQAIEKTGESTKATPASSGRTSPTPASGRSSPTPATAKDKVIQKAADVEKELEEVVDEATLAEIYGKEHVNIIFLGHGTSRGRST